jgi:putative endonuclease
MHYVYVLQSENDRKLYIGCTKNLRQRLMTHNEGLVAATKRRLPLKLVYYETSLHLKDAFHREKYLKSTYGHRHLRSRLTHYFTG